MTYGCGAPAAPIAAAACPRPFGFLGNNWWILILLLLLVFYFTGSGSKCGILGNIGCNWWIWIVLILLLFPGCLGKVFGCA